MDQIGKIHLNTTNAAKKTETLKTAQSTQFDFRAEVAKLNKSTKATSKNNGIIEKDNKYSSKLDDKGAAALKNKVANENKKIEKTLQNEKSSYGMTYNQAKAIVLELQQKYAKYSGNNMYNHLTSEDKQKLNLANATMTEIEQKHSLDNGIENDGLSKTADGKVAVDKKTDEKPPKPDDNTRLAVTAKNTGTQHTFAWTTKHILS